MIKSIIITSVLCLVSLLGYSKGPERVLTISKDTTVHLKVRNYENITFYDSSGNIHRGKIFIPNDSQFYFLNYYKERNSKVYNLNEIHAIDFMVEVNPSSKRKGRIYLSTEQVVALIIVTAGIMAPILLVREIYLSIKLGPGHARVNYTGRDNKRVNGVSAKIVSSST